MNEWNGPDHIPAWYCVEPQTKELIEQVEQLSATQAQQVLDELQKKAMPIRLAEQKAAEENVELESAILAALKKPMTKFELNKVLSDKFESANISAGVARLQRAGTIRSERVYRKGLGYSTVYRI
jgi:hypothetical protein